MTLIAKKFTFSAAHCLRHLSIDHKCSRLHGHNYEVEIVLEGDETLIEGWVVDYSVLSLFKKWLDDNIDHRYIAQGNEDFLSSLRPDEIFFLGGPSTAERLARKFFDSCFNFHWGHYVVAVRVSETGNTWAEFKRGDV